MSLLKKNVLTLTLSLIVYLWFFLFQNPSLNSYKVLGADVNVSIFTQPEAGREPILEAMAEAKHEILTEVYLLTDQEVLESLCNARQRGLAVSVMLEQHPFGGGKFNDLSREKLISCDVSVNWTNPSFALTHEKAIIIDSNVVFILNQNLTNSSFSKNREYDIVDYNTQDVSEIRSIFMSDWERKYFKPANSNIIISPDISRAALTTLIESAAKSIDIEIEDINDSRIADILSGKTSNVKVRLLVPPLNQIPSNKETVVKLKNAGVLVKTLSSPYVHAKLIIIDSTKSYSGSINLSSQSLDQNREVGIILSQSDVVGSLLSKFEEDYEKGLDLTP